MKEVWRKIKESLIGISPGIAESLNKAATQQDIELLEKTIGHTLPKSFIDYLATYNGQNHNNFDVTFVQYNSLLTINEIIEAWKIQIDLFGDESEIDIKENKIQPKIWDKGWIPFTDFLGQQCLVIDINPGKNGAYGQILQLWAGQDFTGDEVVVANSFEEFSQRILNNIVSKDFEVSDEGQIKFNEKWII